MRIWAALAAIAVLLVQQGVPRPLALAQAGAAELALTSLCLVHAADGEEAPASSAAVHDACGACILCAALPPIGPQAAFAPASRFWRLAELRPLAARPLESLARGPAHRPRGPPALS